MFEGIFESESLMKAWEVLCTEIPLGIWETFYVTVLSTALAIVLLAAAIFLTVLL